MLEENVNLQNFSFLTQTLCHKTPVISVASSTPTQSARRYQNTHYSIKICFWHHENKFLTSGLGVMILPSYLKALTNHLLVPSEWNALAAEAIYFVKRDLPLYFSASNIVLALIRGEGEEARSVCCREGKWVCRFISTAYSLFRCCCECKYDFSPNRFIRPLITVRHNERGGPGIGLVYWSCRLLQWSFRDYVTRATFKLDIFDERFSL